jgi:hypothetical protein
MPPIDLPQDDLKALIAFVELAVVEATNPSLAPLAPICTPEKGKEQ